jgi:hypothetical protein
MFSWVLKILPKLDEANLKKMERTLASRFTKIAKGFGKGIMNAMKGAGVVGLGLALVDKLLNPLKEVQESIEKSLKGADDIVTNAKQFDTSAGKLRKVVALGEASGLDKDNLFMLMQKFQAAVAENKADPTKSSAVANYTNTADTADAFFGFIQELQKVGLTDKAKQVRIQQQVFGEKQILKMSDFLNSDFQQAWKDLGLDRFSSGTLDKALQKNAASGDKLDTGRARLTIQDEITKAKLINDGVVNSLIKNDEIALAKENQRLASFQQINALSQLVERVTMQVEKVVPLIGGVIPKVTKFVDDVMPKIDRMLQSPIFKYITGKKDK